MEEASLAIGIWYQSVPIRYQPRAKYDRYHHHPPLRGWYRLEAGFVEPRSEMAEHEAMVELGVDPFVVSRAPLLETRRLVLEPAECEAEGKTGEQPACENGDSFHRQHRTCVMTNWVDASLERGVMLSWMALVP